MKTVLVVQLAEQNKRLQRLKPAMDLVSLQAGLLLMADLVLQLVLTDPQNTLYSQSIRVITQYTTQDVIVLQALNKQTKKRNKPTAKDMAAYQAAFEDLLAKLNIMTQHVVLNG